MLNTAFELGGWRVEPARNQIRAGSEIRELEPKVMKLLVYFSQQAGKVVSREALIEHVWHGRHVVPGAVTRAVYQLRRALTQPGDPHGYIETIRQSGYRLRRMPRPCGESIRPDRTLRIANPKRFATQGASLIAVFLIGVFGSLFFDISDAPGIRSDIDVAEARDERVSMLTDKPATANGLNADIAVLMQPAGDSGQGREARSAFIEPTAALLPPPAPRPLPAPPPVPAPPAPPPPSHGT